MDPENFDMYFMHFCIAVERLIMTSVRSSQSSMWKFVKQWLNLRHTYRNCFYPDVLDLPFLPHLKKSANILAIKCSVNPMIVELHHSLLSTDFQDVPSVVFNALSAAKSSAFTYFWEQGLKHFMFLSCWLLEFNSWTVDLHRIHF